MSEQNIPSNDQQITEAIAELHQHYQQVLKQLGGVIVGMEDVTEQLMIGILCRGHCIVQGMPGLMKKTSS